MLLLPPLSLSLSLSISQQPLLLTPSSLCFPTCIQLELLSFPADRRLHRPMAGIAQQPHRSSVSKIHNSIYVKQTPSKVTKKRDIAELKVTKLCKNTQIIVGLQYLDFTKS